MSTPNSRCAVVGVGVLGTSLCQQILNEPSFDDDIVIGITKSNTHHSSIREKVGASDDRFSLITADEFDDNVKCKNVVFCAPPSGSDDYPAAVKEATEKYWAGLEGGGVFVFTSSGAVYGPGDSGTVSETSATADPEGSPRVARLIYAERAALDAGGCVLRLAGLYNLKRGAHNFWIESGKEITSPPDGIVNQLHYDDAASACLAALKAGPEICQNKVFLISDGQPMSRYAICEAALKAKVYQNSKMPIFATGENQEQSWARGKVYDGTVSNTALKWSPKYKSFADFMEANS